MNNIVKIGTAIKWRGVFDRIPKYYLENIVSLCGSVFRCKVPVTQGKSPIEVIDNVGRIAYANSDIWDVVVDFVDYYNGRIDNEILLTEDRKQILINAINIQKNKNEIDKLKVTHTTWILNLQRDGNFSEVGLIRKLLYQSSMLFKT